ncbi:nuclear factor 7, ovary-like isoform X2 [Corythoichthys intestinalis]|nr:nuclear factor 7, ovary-like isoform X2 [Corythoichthys intestinalis]
MAVAAHGDFLFEQEISCYICLEVFSKPVTTPCGHSFCKACLSTFWDKGGKAKVYQCPLCNASFHKRPELHVNYALKEITEQFKRNANTAVVANEEGKSGKEDTGLFSSMGQSGISDGLVTEIMCRFQRLSTPDVSQSTSNAHPSMGVQINEHKGPPPPYSSLSRNPLSSSPLSAMCPIHQRLRELFCRTDTRRVCSICAESEEHRGHDIIPFKKELDIMKSQLGNVEKQLMDLIGKRERKSQEINNSLLGIDAAAEREIERTVSVFSKLISTVEQCQAQVLELIEMNRRTAQHRSQGLLTALEEEMAELKQRKASLSQLALEGDPILFLQMFPSLSAPPQLTESANAPVSSELTTFMILNSVSQMTEHFQEEIQNLLKDWTKMVQEYAANITLDPDTAHPRLIISVDRKQVFCGEHHQSLPDNPKRFDRVVCVLAHQGFNSGRHYWEVEVGQKTDWDLGVASQSIRRKGKITVSPAHGFWFMSLRDGINYTFRTDPSTVIQVKPRPSRVGIFLDCDNGVVSFYNVEAKLLIYTFRGDFCDTVHPFFSPCTNKSGKNELPLIICPFLTTT